MNIEGVTTGIEENQEILTEVDGGIYQETWYERNQGIRPKRIGFTGSATLRDTFIDVYMGKTFIGRYYPTTIGVVVPVESKDMKAINNAPAGRLEDLKLICGADPTTNQISYRIEC